MITKKKETVSGLEEERAYAYDSMGRLTTVTRVGQPQADEQYGYDAYGRRTTDVAGRTYSYNADDQLVIVGDTSYEYDADGFLTRKVAAGGATTTYEYDHQGHLTRVSLPDNSSVTYTYDPLGRRISRTAGGVTEKYLWVGTTLLAVYDASDTVKMRFRCADGRLPVSMKAGTTTYYLAYDQVGSLRAVWSSSGGVVKKVDYDSFGNVLSDIAPELAVPLGFAGGLWDPATGLVRFGVRDYDPEVGRWLERTAAGSGGRLSEYAYCAGNPVILVDWDGRAPMKVQVGVTPEGIEIYDARAWFQEYIGALEEDAPHAYNVSGLKKVAREMDINKEGKFYYLEGQPLIPSDIMGNVAPAYAVAHVYGPGLVWPMMVAAEAKYSNIPLKNPTLLAWWLVASDQAKASYRFNECGLNLWYGDNPLVAQVMMLMRHQPLLAM